jgi:hypothetical protein
MVELRGHDSPCAQGAFVRFSVVLRNSACDGDLPRRMPVDGRRLQGGFREKSGCYRRISDRSHPGEYTFPRRRRGGERRGVAVSATRCIVIGHRCRTRTGRFRPAATIGAAFTYATFAGAFPGAGLRQRLWIKTERQQSGLDHGD